MGCPDAYCECADFAGVHLSRGTPASRCVESKSGGPVKLQGLAVPVSHDLGVPLCGSHSAGEGRKFLAGPGISVARAIQRVGGS